MSLKLRHLEVFNALVQAGSVSRAAERLNLSQPAVSIALGNLEAELGFRLFHRDRGFFAPTKEALLLQDEVDQGLLSVARVAQRAADIRHGTIGTVSIATNGVLAVNFLPRLIADYQQSAPNIRVELRVHSSRQIANWVSDRQIDIGFIDTPVPVAGLGAQIFDMECVCVMRKDDPLAALAVVTPEALAGRSVIGITGDHMVDRQLDAQLAERNIRVGRTTISYYFAIARNMVAAGRDVALVDPINGKKDLGDGVVWRPFAPRIAHRLAVITALGQDFGQPTAALHTQICAQLQAVSG